MYKTINLLSGVLDAAWLQNEIISHNIANADTPGYKAKSVIFEQDLQEAIKLNKTKKNPKHIPLKYKEPILPVIVTKQTDTVRMDGNNITIETEMAELAENQMFYNAVTQQIINCFQMIKTVISEGRR